MESSRGAARIVLRADDGKKDVGRQHVEIAAEDQRIAEIGKTLDEADQEGIGEAWPHQWPGHRAERSPAIGAQGLRRLFHRGADAVDDADQHEIGNGRKGERLHEQKTEEAIDPAAGRDTEKLTHQPGRHPVAPEEKDDAEADDERRGDDRQYGEQAQQAFGAEIGALVQEREAQPQQSGEKTDGNSEDKTVPGHAPNIGREQPARRKPRLNSCRPATRPLR